MTWQAVGWLTTLGYAALAAAPLVVAARRRPRGTATRGRRAATWAPPLLASLAVAVCWVSLGAPRESPEGHTCAAEPLTGITVDSEDGPDPSCLAVNRTAAGRTAAAAVALSAGGTVLAARRGRAAAEPADAADASAAGDVEVSR
ncbi:hypothetical protein ACFUMH_09635 [Cellulomonas sp. NPDC057328]|uniref:hypothetical protein n=1 Tax=Cellulomonas sp. NPDC057328 TaxID=3346101 RepID=UPI00363D72D6